MTTTPKTRALKQARLREFLFGGAQRQTNGCLLWRGRSSHIKIGHKDYSVGRLVYSLLIGPVPAAHDVRHICNDRVCIEKLHLRVIPITPAGQEHTSIESYSCQA